MKLIKAESIVVRISFLFCRSIRVLVCSSPIFYIFIEPVSMNLPSRVIRREETWRKNGIQNLSLVPSIGWREKSLDILLPRFDLYTLFTTYYLLLYPFCVRNYRLWNRFTHDAQCTIEKWKNGENEGHEERRCSINVNKSYCGVWIVFKQIKLNSPTENK